MSEYSSLRAKPKRKMDYEPRSIRSSNRSMQGISQGRFKGNSRFSSSKKAALKFDPSMFMKNVEEQTASVEYIPKHKFSDFLIEPQLKTNILNKGYKNPTPIQDQAIPLLLEGKDVIGAANTGTGKTAAFLIPLINNVLTGKTHNILVIAPTRELADQINQELKSFIDKTNITSALCIGGANMAAQMRALRNNPTFVIGTPGRLLDLEQNQLINFNKFTSIVLDEVDRMLDMGFIRDIKYIISKLPAKRHSLFFSATMPKELERAMQGFLNNPISISVRTRESAENVNQSVMKVTSLNKLDTLHDLLIKPEFKKVIIFLRTKRSVDRLSKSLVERGFAVTSIHGDKTQAQRTKALSYFKNNSIKILLATDVVARGIDIDDVSHVINYDLPQAYEDYIHRIGRTGRADKVGQAITFIE